MLYTLNDQSLTLGGQEIFSHISMEIREHDHVALVGPNGAGKTSLLRLIFGQLNADRDDRRQGSGIASSRKITMGMLSQVPDLNEEQTVEEYLLGLFLKKENSQADRFSRARFDYEMEFKKLFTGLGFSMEEAGKPLADFSGGELTKISLIHLLLEKPDLLLLDEPTNHLDIASVEWLEEYLIAYPKAIVCVSHDRFFLDRIATQTYELEGGRLTHYSGNYSDYRKLKRKQSAKQEKDYEAQQAEIKRLDDLIERFKHKPSKAAFARSQKTRLSHMKRIEKPVQSAAHLFTEPIEPLYPGGKWVYEAEHLKIGYDAKHVLAELSLRIRRGQKIAVIGANGVGKTTFLKTVSGDLTPIKGKSNLGLNILLGTYDQKSAELLSEKTVYEHFKECFPSWQEKDLRNTLAAYLFQKEEVYKKVSDLSGGERSRLYLAELLCARPNFMLLDEPTNHMDITAKETLESAFRAYKGSLLFVSHDRYFVSQVADAILLFEDGKVFYYPFGYAHYLEHVRNADSGELSALISAEDAAMVAGLRAVPKPERHRLKEQNTELAYVDWKRGLAAGPVEDETARLKQTLIDQNPALPENEEAIRKAEDALTQACLDWYDIYLETE